jgi:hypothetical protein
MLLVFPTYVYHDARFRECERFFVPRRSCGSFNEDTNYSRKTNVLTHTQGVLVVRGQFGTSKTPYYASPVLVPNFHP